MSFLRNESEYIASRITNKGRQKIAQGNFNISYFQIGDSEFDYAFSQYDGNVNDPQKIFTPLDKDSFVKYPYKFSESTVTGTTYGTPVQFSEVQTIKNNMGPAGFVSEYILYVPNPWEGSSIKCQTIEIDYSKLNGTTTIVIPTGHTFYGCEFITVAFTRLITAENIISGSSSSLVYKVMDVTDSSLIVDRNTPNLTLLSGSTATIICNKCDSFYSGVFENCGPNTQNPEDQQDPWTLNIVWGQKPAGMDVPTLIDEDLSGYTSNVFVSTKEFLGYNLSSGQTINTGTTITNSLLEDIIVFPEEQHSLAIIHYNEIGNSMDPEKFFKYEDYISGDLDGITHFEIYIPFIYYHRNSASTIGARFHMDSTDYYINSSATDVRLYNIKYRYLLDEQDIRVGKIFVNHKIIVFDDQEIVAALEYKSNRRYTLPIPKISLVPVDTTCSPTNILGQGLFDGVTGQTIYTSYLLEITGTTGMTGMHCNYYSNVSGTTIPSDVSLKFASDDFKFMKSSLPEYTEGYVANKFSILAQIVDNGDQPTPDGWKIIDFTDRIPNHTVGNFIDPVNLRGARFVITYDDYDSADRYDLEDYLGDLPDEPSTDPEFGDTQPFPGSVKLTRATDLQVFRFLVNLPSGQFETSQNPTYNKLITKPSLRITEIALLNENKEVLVIGKTPKPIVRTGTQVFGVKIDL